METTEQQVRHTPGPWRYEVKPDVERMKVARQFGLSSDGLTHCALSTSGEFDHTPKFRGPRYLGVIYEEADARLIAAAPDLLDALKLAAQLMEDADFDHGDEPELQALAQVRAAIAKAEGR